MKRYNPQEVSEKFICMAQDEEGEWVKYEESERIQTNLENAVKLCDPLEQRIKALEVGQMTEERAREIFAKGNIEIDGDGLFYRESCIWSYSNCEAWLDRFVTVDELKAIAWWMEKRNEPNS